MKKNLSKIATGLLLLGLVVGAYFLRLNRTSQVPESEKWKTTFVEPETAVRPARFEAMKWHEGDRVEMRAPASKHK